jgi:hypothetical protein
MHRIGIVFIACALVSCVSEPELDAKPWTQRKFGLETFTYKLQRLCECIPEYTGPFLVRAVPQGVLEVRRVRPSDTILVTEGVQSYSIDSLIAEGGRELARKHASSMIRYHDVYGFPEYVYIDFVRRIADEEYTFEITDFVAVPIQKFLPD